MDLDSEEYLVDTIQDQMADEDKKRMIRRLIVLGVVMFLAAFYFVWGTVLNFGTLRIQATPSYNIMVFEDQTFSCNENPCEISLSRGEKVIGFFRAGYSAENITVEIPLWDTVTITPKFILEPYLSEIPSLPALAPSATLPQYEFNYDDSSNNWKLTQTGDPAKHALSYFIKKPQNPQIFGSKDSVLIIEHDKNLTKSPVYFMDLKAQERTKIGEIEATITSAIPSPNGQYFALFAEDGTLAIAGKHMISTLTTKTPKENTAWTIDNNFALLFNKEAKWVFALYDPKTLSTRTLIETDKFTSAPETFFASSAVHSLYATFGTKNYEVTY